MVLIAIKDITGPLSGQVISQERETGTESASRTEDMTDMTRYDTTRYDADDHDTKRLNTTEYD